MNSRSMQVCTNCSPQAITLVSCYLFILSALRLTTSSCAQDKSWLAALPASDTVSCSKVAHLLPQTPDSLPDYNEDVRYYTTKSMNGGTTFKCAFCEHSVTTLDFSHANGNRRTQAAAMINQHAASLHLRASLPTKLGGRAAL